MSSNSTCVLYYQREKSGIHCLLRHETVFKCLVKVSDLRKVLQWKLEGNTSADEDSSSCQIGVLDVFGDDSNLEKIFESNSSLLNILHLTSTFCFFFSFFFNTKQPY